MRHHSALLPALLLALVLGLLPGRLAGQGGGAYPIEDLQPIIVPWELGGPDFHLHTKDQDSAPFPAHRVMANVYYVGQADYASYLITTPKGHILIDTTYESGVPLIQKSVEQLKFNFKDIKILLITSAHADRAGGAARVKELTGAQVMVMDEDAKAVETGGKDMPPVKVDRVLHDKDQVQLDTVSIVAYRTPAYTRGNTTYVWKAKQSGNDYSIVLAGDMSSDARTLANLPYPTLIEDYRSSFRLLKSLPCDIFLGTHGKYFDLAKKYPPPKGPTGLGNPYTNSNAYWAYVKLMEQSFYYKLDAARRQVDAAQGRN